MCLHESVQIFFINLYCDYRDNNAVYRLKTKSAEIYSLKGLDYLLVCFFGFMTYQLL